MGAHELDRVTGSTKMKYQGALCGFFNVVSVYLSAPSIPSGVHQSALAGPPLHLHHSEVAMSLSRASFRFQKLCGTAYQRGMATDFCQGTGVCGLFSMALSFCASSHELDCRAEHGCTAVFQSMHTLMPMQLS